MSIWNFLSFDAKAKIINALPLAYANFIGHQHITADSQNGDTDWLGQPLPVELAEISDFNKSTGEFTFSFIKPQPNGGSFHSYRTRMCITETQEGLAFSAAGKQVSVSKKPTKEMLSEVIALAVESGLLYSQ
ncbi:hypothetical protein AAIP97_003423 [Klebsiella pneumoniae]|uniref:hypothetical protein n=1 Tax=Klebsiella pneumoniae TaxID=573 RepID=UPI0014194388|nr:hypothetical protein [Klebsiella pneumoniae]EKS8533959.1 hypothetical protein [Klebsiella pneumoniae]EKU5923087.1 hypothetical protein [Klebsiella pneumoniae]EKU6755956.1 hypothetical protein [Klebsiella pneumoniae]EKW8977520.1 hypothetical protein [Klebsiella pneumoniae]EKX0153551.1 hypothetical protein [Klebsiella pneumoniae]